MKKLFKTLLFLALLISYNVKAQNNKSEFSGTVVDTFNHPVHAGTAILFKLKDSTKKYYSVITKAGKFAFEKVQYGNYILRITSIGFAPKEIEMTINTPNQDAGILKLNSHTKVLEEVSINSRKKLLESLPGKTIYNVSADPMAIGKSVAEIAANIPGVAINAEGGLMVDGESRVILLVNGRQSNANPIDLLAQLPPANIEKLELITGADPRFASMNGAAVINIILKKNKQSGMSGNTSAQVNTFGSLNFSFNLSKYIGKVNLYSYLSSDDRFFIMKRSSERKNISTSEMLLNNSGENDIHHSLRSLILGADIYVDSFNTLTIENKLSIHSDIFKGTTNTTFKNNGSFINSSVILHASPKDIENTFSVNYVRSFKKTKKFWETEISGTLFNMKNSSNYFPSSNSETLNLDNHALYARSEFNTPVKKINEWNIGIDFSYATTKNTNTQQSLNLSSENNIIIDYKKTKIALYTSYIFKIKKWSIRPGMRIEKAITTMNHSENNPVDFNLASLFPTLNLLWNGKNNRQLVIDFIRKVEYPDLYNFYTQPNQADTFNLFIGNSALIPSIRNDLSVQYRFTFNKINFNLKAFGRITTNALSEAAIIFPVNKIISTIANVGNIYTYGGSANITVNITPKWNIRFNGNASLSYVDFKKELFATYSNLYNFSGSFINRYSILSNLDAEITLRATQIYRDINEISNHPMYNLSAQFNYKINKGKWVASIMASDILNTMRRNFSITPAPDLEQVSIYIPPMRFIQATVRYRFGGSEKQREKKIELEKETFSNG